MPRTDLTARLAAAMNDLTDQGEEVNALLPETGAAHKKKDAKSLIKEIKDSDSSLADNPIYKIMLSKDKSGAEKIDEIARYLTAEKDNFSEARRRFSEFEAYYTHLHGESRELDERGIARLIDEVKGGLYAEVDQIVKNINRVDEGVGECNKLLDVMHEARLKGQTIDEIAAALKMNDMLLEQIEDLSNSIDRLKDRESFKDEMLKSKLLEKAESEKGFGNKVRRFFGPDKDIQDGLRIIEKELKKVRDELTETQEQKKAKEAKRDASLESGPLTILRTLDATGKGFSDKIVETAEASLDLIQSGVRSVKRLLSITRNSEASAAEINRLIGDGMVREVVLSGALQRVVTTTTAQSGVLQGKLTVLDEKLTGLHEGEAEHALTRVERIETEQTHSEAQNYEEVLRKTQTVFAQIEADNAQIKARANKLASLLQSQRDLLTKLDIEALPTTSRSLHIILEESVARQTSESGMCIAAATDKARELARLAAAAAKGTQSDLHAQEIEGMKAVATALEETQEQVVENIEEMVRHGKQAGSMMATIKQAAADLSGAVEQLNAIRPMVAGARAEGEGAPATAKKLGAEENALS